MGWYEEYMSNTYITNLESVIKGIKEKDKLIDFYKKRIKNWKTNITKTMN